MFIGRLALGIAAVLTIVSGARAQTELITFEAAESRGAIWEIVSTLPGCTIGTPRGSGGVVSALVDFDCQAYVPPPAGSRPPPGNVVRLFTRMILEPPWVVQVAAASYRATSGASASVLIIRPAIGATGMTRNPWVEFRMHPSGPTLGTVRVNLLAAAITTPPPPFNICLRPSNELIFSCSTNDDCSAGYRCASECASTCMRY
jgi:hypothetical protein